jgi:hypothetical protein
MKKTRSRKSRDTVPLKVIIKDIQNKHKFSLKIQTCLWSVDFKTLMKKSFRSKVLDFLSSVCAELKEI